MTAPLDRAARRIALGGMSEVFCVAGRLERGEPATVVLKRLYASYVTQPRVAAMFRHECALLAQLAHRGIPRSFGLEADGATLAMRLEWCDAQPLGVPTLASGRLGLDASLELALQLLDILVHVHERRDAAGRWLASVHRDVAPDNVLVSAAGVVHLVDFGIATSVDLPLTRDGGVAGTPGYFAPEVVLGAASDARADLFSMGVMLYESTVGQRLFPGSRLAAMSACVEAEVPRPGSVVEGYPEALEAVVLRALARDPDERFESARAMREALTAAAVATSRAPSAAGLAQALARHVQEKPSARR